ncbi:hypothetical protein Taro_012510 [Colocasia esculenta]|uniref:Uncharacterized protein n=1 Tax=Colocasia esculenta TaxID=4460 RepID=A0A843UD30_COLES|nr:hypothetical protein [Colocasia esculenta]
MELGGSYDPTQLGSGSAGSDPAPRPDYAIHDLKRRKKLWQPGDLCFAVVVMCTDVFNDSTDWPSLIGGGERLQVVPAILFESDFLPVPCGPPQTQGVGPAAH